MALFSSRSDEARRQQQQSESEEIHRDETLQQELSALVASGDKREVTRALTEAEAAVGRGTKLDIYDMKLMELGRCPKCQARTENYLYTTVCPACGWYRRRVPESGRAILHLNDGTQINCDRVFRANYRQYLCVTDGVVQQHVMSAAVRRIEYIWTEAELAAAKEQAKMQIVGACSWCEQALDKGDADGPFADYVAFGRQQERYVFCSTRCMRQFREHFPARVHRNCYEVDCNVCDKCIKRYDLAGFKRTILI